MRGGEGGRAEGRVVTCKGGKGGEKLGAGQVT